MGDRNEPQAPARRGLGLERLGLGAIAAATQGDGERPVPLDRRALLRCENPPAERDVPAERLTVSSARLVCPVGTPKEPVTLARSWEHQGCYELPTGMEPISGLPGRGAQVVGADARRTQETRAPRSDSGHIEGSAPAWLALGIHPRPVFSEGSYKRTLRDGRRVEPSTHTHISPPTDDRINIYPSTYPECCICRIDVSIRATRDGSWQPTSQGTGFMIGARQLMTAGHVRPPRPYADWMIRVVPAFYEGASLFGSSFRTYASDYVAYETDTGDDFMACRLYDPIGETTGWFGAISYDDDWEDRPVWSMCGYPYDHSGERFPTYQGSIPVVDEDDGDDVRLADGGEYDTTQIESRADDASGLSGSPLYQWFSDGHMYAIGTHHGWETDPEAFGSDEHSVAAGGDGFVELVKWARRSWP